jgi:hypothetical protein
VDIEALLRRRSWKMRILVILLALSVLWSLPAAADVEVSHSYVPKSPYLVGYFGGIRAGNILRFLENRQGRPKFYRINPGEAANYAGIPLYTQLRITVDKGLVTSLEVLEGQR